MKAKARHLSSIETRDSRIFLGFWGQSEMALAHTRVAFVWVIIILKKIYFDGTFLLLLMMMIGVLITEMWNGAWCLNNGELTPKI